MHRRARRRASTGPRPTTTVRVVVLAAEGKHFSCRSRPQGDPRRRREPGPRCATRPRASSATSRSCTATSCVRIRDFRKPTIAAVQGACIAAGLMLACMCDLIVAADDARFSNPVLRMTRRRRRAAGRAVGARAPQGQGVPALRRDARRRRGRARSGSSTGSCPAPSCATRAREMADKVALVPPVTAERGQGHRSTTRSTCMGQRESWRYHFMVHQFVSNTADRARQAHERAQGGRHGRGQARAGRTRVATR